jgi:hypothetical protein
MAQELLYAFKVELKLIPCPILGEDKARRNESREENIVSSHC